MSPSEDTPKAEFLRQLCRNVANNMYRQDPDAYLVRMRPDDLGLAPGDLSVGNKTYRSLHKVKKAFSFNKTPTSSLKRAVSSMISPLTSSNLANGSNRERMGSTPSGDLQNLRLQSCSNLLNADSPRSTRSGGGMTPSRSVRCEKNGQGGKTKRLFLPCF